MMTKGILKILKNVNSGVVCHEFNEFRTDGLPLLWATPTRRCPYEDRLVAKTHFVFDDSGGGADAEGEIQSSLHPAPSLASLDFRFFS
ncbi:MAG: hypothetical protein OEY80_02560 [Nitrospirota bacterium]|jgi:hypothetical protein|nr:hypothetical protein [Nitrospirota bacterium]MDH4359959.1 hypothetical protein [Nitrospirota bacterium]MDH5295599.1 hypothetical protein [Nitrospirota bacterium]MDH5574347.1 hypothetical protein [Nitrospirota bacterium]